MKKGGTVWVLGASSGLGLAAAEAFAENGWLVVAGARSFTGGGGGAVEKNKGGKPLENPTTTERLRTLPGVSLLPLDVTDAASCGNFIRDALSISDRVDALCYAAGVLALGSCEETGYDQYELVMKTNYLGMTRMVEAALPLMREQRRGRIILFSSLNGLMGIPFQSAYTASKHAIEGYAECLALEVSPFGIEVCVVEPGDHRGGSQKYRVMAGERESSPYAREYVSACRTIHRDEANGLSPEALGRKVVRNANRRKMRYHLRVARMDQRAAIWLHAVLWPGFIRMILRGYYVKKPGESGTKGRVA